ncbi:PH domain-containing protein [Streptomyces fuscigenes]|uniref:PH domain-containing protein n=1 Tax=Streptomyces fuscigenes TaxID=1528880 RepID=UPI001F3EBA7C|nr:PH domain-containing protein [Streptomyces fuscigenes]MCF3963405.1 PH domain-containing protein [Streptomyces fuscigenes]
MARSEQQQPEADPAAPAAPAPAPGTPVYSDRVYRSGGGIAGGVLVLALVLWLGIDALVSASGRAPWLALAAMLFVVPLLTAYTIRPAVFAGEDQVRIRNPFRTIVVPWGAMKNLRARFSTELFTNDGAKFQMWAVPVSLRQRKRADRRMGRLERSAPASSASRQAALSFSSADGEPKLAQADQALVEMRELAERAVARGGAEASGAPVVRWAYEVLAPALAGAVLLIILVAM